MEGRTSPVPLPPEGRNDGMKLIDRLMRGMEDVIMWAAVRPVDLHGHQYRRRRVLQIRSPQCHPVDGRAGTPT